MSLKAKLEAVIYAAEEPVTLAQLAALFADEALEWKAEQQAASAEANRASDEGESLPILNAELEFAEMEQPSAAEPFQTVEEVEVTQEDAPAETSEAASSEQSGEAELATPAEAAAEGASIPTPAEPTAADLEAEAKRQTRAVDREVRAVLRALLDELIAAYASDDRGIEIKEIAGGFRMATKPECHDAARMFVKSLKPALKLSLPALETLAVIAYKQPVTAPEVNEIRGVDSSGVFGSLLARKLISTAGRKQVIGRPILYKTTKEFLLKFGLNDVNELPSMEEFEKMAQLEFEDMEPLEEAQAGAGEEGVPEVDDDPDPVEDEPEDAPVEEPANPGDKPVAEPKEVPDGDPAKAPVSEPPAASQQAEESAEEEGTNEQAEQTAAMADSEETPAGTQHEPAPETTETPAETPATQAATTPAEAAPAPPSNLEHAETETVPHD